MEPYRAYWGKAQPANVEGPTYHPLVYHNLDVAAVGQTLLHMRPAIRALLASLTGLSERSALSWLTYFLALHDLGKFAEGFQALQPPNFLQHLRGRPLTKEYTVRHDSLGAVLWLQVLWPIAKLEDWFGLGRAGPAHGEVDEAWIDALRPWAECCTGHHGRPPRFRDNSGTLRATRHFGDEERDAAMAFAGELVEFLGPPAGSNDTSPVELARCMPRASWLIAGIAVLADWLGSNQRYFPYRTEPLPLAVYWTEIALPQAERALRASGIVPVPIAPFSGAVNLIPKGYRPTPLQQYAESVSLDGNQHLFILEDITGAGKTEAALILAHRLMATGVAEGLYFALPTMATADQMYKRVGVSLSSLFDPGQRPSLILAHSGRDLSKQFGRSVLPVNDPSQQDSRSYAEAPGWDADQPAGARCAAWLADNAKKALLAQVGVGTVDQALLGILPTQHQSLRLLGLARKVLVADEVHAYDAYTGALVAELLRFHSALGGSAILLSATLPQHVRRELVDAFEEGSGASRGYARAKPPSSEEYPLATHVAAGAATETGVSSRPDLSRWVDVRIVHTEQAAESVIRAAVDAGSCVCWLRNTISDAIAGFDRLRPDLADRVTLFHARFAMADRLEIQNRALLAFGKQGGAASRVGRVLVATQVVEQSLDLDFDTIVTDLAPIDRLIQRAGRVARHARDTQGNPLAASGTQDQRGTPCLTVLAPDPVDEPGHDWYAGLFPSGQWVYPDHGQLWMTARLLVERGGWRLPEDARGLIEEVFGDGRWGAPPGLQARSSAAYGKEQAEGSFAIENVLKPEEGYRIPPHHPHSQWVDEEHTPTRIGERVAPVYLARREGDELVPWYVHPPDSWPMSRVAVRRRLLSSVPEPTDPALRAAMAACQRQLPDKGRWSTLLPLADAADGTWMAEALDGNGREVEVHYDSIRGLQFGGEPDE